jgi:hypothetical protein
VDKILNAEFKRDADINMNLKLTIDEKEMKE